MVYYIPFQNDYLIFHKNCKHNNLYINDEYESNFKNCGCINFLQHLNSSEFLTSRFGNLPIELIQIILDKLSDDLWGVYPIYIQNSYYKKDKINIESKEFCNIIFTYNANNRYIECINYMFSKYPNLIRIDIIDENNYFITLNDTNIINFLFNPFTNIINIRKFNNVNKFIINNYNFCLIGNEIGHVYTNRNLINIIKNYIFNVKIKDMASTYSSFITLDSKYNTYIYGKHTPEYILNNKLNKNVAKITSTNTDYIAISNNGSFYSWKNEEMGVIYDASTKNNKAIDVFSNQHMFIILLDNLNILMMGKYPIEFIKNVKKICNTEKSFGVINNEGNFWIIDRNIYCNNKHFKKDVMDIYSVSNYYVLIYKNGFIDSIEYK